MASNLIKSWGDHEVRFEHSEWALTMGCPVELRGRVRDTGRAIGSVCTQVVIQVMSVEELGGEGV